MNDYDLERVYDTEIAPLMEQILAVCQREQMPMFASFAYAYEAETDTQHLCTSALQFKGRNINRFDECHKTVMAGPAIAAFAVTHGGGGNQQQPTEPAQNAEGAHRA